MTNFAGENAEKLLGNYWLFIEFSNLKNNMNKHVGNHEVVEAEVGIEPAYTELQSAA